MVRVRQRFKIWSKMREVPAAEAEHAWRRGDVFDGGTVGFAKFAQVVEKRGRRAVHEQQTADTRKQQRPTTAIFPLGDLLWFC